MKKFVNWFTNLLYSPKPEEVTVEDRWAEYRYQGMVSEPVQTFVKYVQANPKNFRIRQGNSTYILPYSWQYENNFYTVTDRKLGDEWTIYITENSSSMPTHIGHILYSVYGLRFELNGWELRYLWDHLFPVLSRQKALKRRARILSGVDNRKRELKVAQEKAIRQEYYQKYKEQL